LVDLENFLFKEILVCNNKTIRDKDLFEEIMSNTMDFFYNKLPSGFESREGQEDMSFDIVEAMRDDEHIIVEAGVGIGKSYAYLVPLIIYNQMVSLPIIISTSTIALQEQLVADIKSLSPLLGYSPQIVLAKGMTHFICKERALRYLDNIKTNKLNWLLDWINADRSGDRTEIPQKIDESIWKNINVDSCKYTKCKYYRECFFIKKRDNMQKTKGIILCNHDLLIADAVKKSNFDRPLLSDNTSYIVIDEAHNLEEKARNALTISYSKKDLHLLYKNAYSFLLKTQGVYDENKKLKDAEKWLNKLFTSFVEQIQQQINEEKDNGSIEKFYILQRTEYYIKSLISILEDFDIKIQLVDTRIFEEEQTDLIEDISKVIRLLRNLIDENSNSLFWLEISNRRTLNNNKVYLYSCPKKLDKELQRLFFINTRPRTILTSATLTNNFEGENKEKYSYIVKNLGILEDKTVFSPPKPSPFPYDENALIYYNESLPSIKNDKEEFLKKSIDVIIDLLNITNGKSLILFTSKDDLNEVHKKLIERKLPWTILKQEEGSSQDTIIKSFKKDINSVLLGTGAFWEGINIDGISLSNLIIFRLPFPVPDPIIDYKCSTYNDGLLEVLVPEMIIKLRQGVGRLIRKKTDKGIVTILDSRVNNKSQTPYKNIIWDSLPIKNKTNCLDNVKKFIEEININ